MDTLPNGTEITWSSQAAGSAKAKTGSIVCYLPPNESADDKAREHAAGRKPIAMEGNNRSSVPRYLVALPDGPTKKSLRFYTPLASVVERAVRPRTA